MIGVSKPVIRDFQVLGVEYLFPDTKSSFLKDTFIPCSLTNGSIFVVLEAIVNSSSETGFQPC